ncbi:MAG: hypothetical protein HRT63_13370 [Erythrobacter sp.]|nr:hypothetical protein [Erythrobacter sp.]
MTTKYKKCSKCGEVKEVGEYGKDKSNKDGLRPSCKSCKKKLDSEYRKNNKDKIAEYRKRHYKDHYKKYKDKKAEYAKNNKEKIAKYQAEYYKNNKDKINKKSAEYGYEYRKNNKEKIAKKNAEYHNKNKDKLAKYGAEYRKNNKEKISKYNSQWAKKNKALVNSYAMMRIAKKKNLTPPLTTYDKERIEALYKEAKQLEKKTGAPYHVDHVWPISKGGVHHWCNLEVIPEARNLSKSDRHDGVSGVSYNDYMLAQQAI